MGHSTHTAPDLSALGEAAGLYCDVAGKWDACGSATGRSAHATKSHMSLQSLAALPSNSSTPDSVAVLSGEETPESMSMSMFNVWVSMSISNVDVDVAFEFDVDVDSEFDVDIDFDVWFMGSGGRPASASVPPPPPAPPYRAPPPAPPAQSQRQGSNIHELHDAVITCTLCWRCRRQSNH
jgi:hypothetical protein